MFSSQNEDFSAFDRRDILKLFNKENILLAVTSNLKRKIYSYYSGARKNRWPNIEWNDSFDCNIIRFLESSKLIKSTITLKMLSYSLRLDNYKKYEMIEESDEINKIWQKTGNTLLISESDFRAWFQNLNS